MDIRKEQILNTLIDEHIKTGIPVSSGLLVKKYKLDISPATARSEMAALEEDGYIIQPHTSAGRIPTELAYRYYLENIKEKELSKTELDFLAPRLKTGDEQELKETAKIISRLSGNTVFWAFHRHNLYYTGISNLFQQPEFSQLDLIYDLSAVVDRFDEIIGIVYEQIGVGQHILIGHDNPFGDYCSTILFRYKTEDNDSIFGILGPTRMDYQKNLALTNFVKERTQSKK